MAAGAKHRRSYPLPCRATCRSHRAAEGGRSEPLTPRRWPAHRPRDRQQFWPANAEDYEQSPSNSSENRRDGRALPGSAAGAAWHRTPSRPTPSNSTPASKQAKFGIPRLSSAINRSASNGRTEPIRVTTSTRSDNDQCTHEPPRPLSQMYGACHPPKVECANYRNTTPTNACSRSPDTSSNGVSPPSGQPSVDAARSSTLACEPGRSSAPPLLRRLPTDPESITNLLPSAAAFLGLPNTVSKGCLGIENPTSRLMDPFEFVHVAAICSSVLLLNQRRRFGHVSILH